MGFKMNNNISELEYIYYFISVVLLLVLKSEYLVSEEQYKLYLLYYVFVSLRHMSALQTATIS